jgi:hypothetical protein
MAFVTRWLQRPPSVLLAAAAVIALLVGLAILQRSLAYLQVVSWAAKAPYDVPTSLMTEVTPETTSHASSADGPSAIPVNAAVAGPVRVRLAANLPSDVMEALFAEAEVAGAPYRLVEGQEADLQIDMQKEPDGVLFAFRVYVPVARFATLRQGVTTEELKAIWSGQAATPLLVDEDAWASLRWLWGEPAAGAPVVSVRADALADRLWAEPEALGIVPFHRLEPRLKALALDGHLATDNALVLAEDGAPADYPLTIRIFAHGPAEAIERMRAALAERVVLADRDASRLTVLIMTGVTALTRATAAKMEAYNDYAYPAHKIASVLAAADITHVSNEIPFVAGCPVNPDPDNLIFCSKPEYVATLKEIGTDIVGLTGNHMNDYGHEAMLASLDYYREQGIRTYAAGRNAAEAVKPLLVEDHGNRLAFLGANQFGPSSNWAGEDTPGSARYDFATMAEQIKAARQDEGADLVLVELQWEESYEALPLPSQLEAFSALSDAGADIVTGVQSHVPQALAFRHGRLILYGLGNLFFDQMFALQTRQGLIARHVIHRGRHLSTDLLLTVIEDFAQPRWATEPERQEVLTRVFRASGW